MPDPEPLPQPEPMPDPDPDLDPDPDVGGTMPPPPRRATGTDWARVIAQAMNRWRWSESESQKRDKSYWEQGSEYAPSLGSPPGAKDTHLALIKASAAYARGATGMGETVMVVDRGIYEQHAEFGGGKVELATPRDRPGVDDNGDHGTAVTGVLAARRDGTGMHGVAFDAGIKLLHVNLQNDLHWAAAAEPDNFSTTYRDGPVSRSFDRYLSQATGDVSIINMSFGGFGPSIHELDESDLRAHAAGLVRALAQAGTPVADRKIMVWSAGNILASHSATHRNSPGWLSALGVHFPELRAHTLTVVAVGRDGEIFENSHRCGIAWEICIAAPGADIYAPLSPLGARTNRYGATAGTSFAAPVVAGALALVRQYFRGQVGNTELVTRIMATANKTGRYSDRTIYGQGLLDLDAATSPVGSTAMFTGTDFGATRYASESSTLALSPSFGSSSARLRRQEIAMFDELKAPFFLPMETFLLTSPSAKPLAGTLARMREPVRRRALPGGGTLGFSYDTSREMLEKGAAGISMLSLMQPVANGRMMFLGYRAPHDRYFGLHRAGVVADDWLAMGTGLSAPYPALAQDGMLLGGERRLGLGTLRAAVFGGTAQWNDRRDPDPGRAYGVRGEYQWSPDLARYGASVQFGWLHEEERMLGARANGAFGTVRGHTWFGGATGHWSLGPRWTGFAAAHLGLSDPRLGNDRRMLRAVTPVWSSSFGAGALGKALWTPRDRLSIQISQPHRVESGKARLRWAAGRTRYGDLLLKEASIPLAPDVRQIDVELKYDRPFGEGELWLAGAVSRNPGHIQDASTAYAAFVRYFLRF